MKELIEQRKEYILNKLKRNQALYSEFNDNFISNVILKEQFIMDVLDSFDTITYDRVEKWTTQMNTMLDNDYESMMRRIDEKRTISK